MNRTLAPLRAFSLLCLLLALLGPPTRGVAYDAVYAFGDSLTDTGRKGPSGTLANLYYNGRYSNGKVWVEHLSARLGLPYNPTNNLALSGAQTDDTLGEVTNFFPTVSIDQSLFVVWAGGNDFLQEYDKYWFDDPGWDQFTARSAANISNAVLNLLGKGARTILVPNTVDVTRIPFINSLPLPEFSVNYLQGKVQLFNSRLFAALDAIARMHPEARILKADVYAKLQTMLALSSRYGFVNTEDGAIDDPTFIDKSFDGPGARYLFWDPIHPTTKGHGVIADYFLLLVQPLTPVSAISSSTGTLSLTAWNMHYGKLYSLQTSSNCQAWTTLRSIAAYSEVPIHLPLTNNAAWKFFRVK